jgi:hypothetical protein
MIMAVGGRFRGIRFITVIPAFQMRWMTSL